MPPVYNGWSVVYFHVALLPNHAHWCLHRSDPAGFQIAAMPTGCVSGRGWALQQFPFRLFKPGRDSPPVLIAVETPKTGRLLEFLITPDAQALSNIILRQRYAALDGNTVPPLLIGLWYR